MIESTRVVVYTHGHEEKLGRPSGLSLSNNNKERERPTGLAIHLRQRLKFERKKWRRKRKPWLIIIQSPFRCKGSGEGEKLSIFAQFPLSRSVGMWFYLVAKVNRRSCCCNDRCTSGMRLASLCSAEWVLLISYPSREMTASNETMTSFSKEGLGHYNFPTEMKLSIFVRLFFSGWLVYSDGSRFRHRQLRLAAAILFIHSNSKKPIRPTYLSSCNGFFSCRAAGVNWKLGRWGGIGSDLYAKTKEWIIDDDDSFAFRDWLFHHNNGDWPCPNLCLCLCSCVYVWSEQSGIRGGYPKPPGPPHCRRLLHLVEIRTSSPASHGQERASGSSWLQREHRVTRVAPHGLRFLSSVFCVYTWRKDDVCCVVVVEERQRN